MSATEWLDPDLIGNMLRTFGSVLNSCVYDLLSAMYQIFFNVSSAQLFENETIKNFYGRVQLIIGVFMVFKLAVSILQGIMDPEKFTSGKEGGFGSVITRVIVALIMLAVIVPINVPDVQNANSYEKYINNNGLLFGTLYSLQDRILSENTLGRLILGTTDDDDDDSDSSSATQQEKLKRAANIFASTILKGFLRINMRPEDEWVDDNDNNPQNWYCGEHLNDSDISDALTVYNQLDVSTGALLSSNMIHAKCNVEGGFFGDEKFLFYFNWTISLVIGVIFLVILVGFTIDIAVRSVKLAILRLLAPIPIISYIEPKSAKDGMFASWVKSLTSTYLDLFLRLAIVYFVIFIIQDMMVNGIVIDQAGGMVGIVSVIFIWIGLFFFAKMAPKFIKDALGIKGPGMTNIGLSGMLSAAGAVRQGGTLMDALDAGGSAVDTQIQAYNQGKAAPGLGATFNAGRDLAAQMITGNEKATYRGMNRGRRRLAAEGITPWEADKVHSASIAAEAFTERMADDARRGKFRYMDDAGNMNTYKWKDDHGIVHDVTNKKEMSLALAQQRERSGILKAQDSKIDAEVKKNMQSRSYRDKKRMPNTKDPSIINVQGRLDQRRSNRYNARYNGSTYTPRAPGGNTHAAGADLTDHL